MAPEQVRGGDLGSAADVWGLGVVLYEALTGQAAFDPDPGTGASGHRSRSTATTAATAASSSSSSSSGGSWSDTVERAARRHHQLDGPPAPVRRAAAPRCPPSCVALIDGCLAPEAARPTLGRAGARGARAARRPGAAPSAGGRAESAAPACSPQATKR